MCEGLGYTDFNTYLAIPEKRLQCFPDKREQLFIMERNTKLTDIGIGEPLS